MTLTRLHVLKPLDNELTSLVVAVKMQVCTLEQNTLIVHASDAHVNQQIHARLMAFLFCAKQC